MNPVPENFQGLETWLEMTSKAWKFCILCAALALPLQAASPWRETLSFTITTNVSMAASVFVVGSHSDLGSWNPTKAIQLGYVGG
ncbi:MAG: CBM20 domain-containing protein [Kiritimatiellae bacterium]|nr:CBM20 domain-containing protein [Kiritimatiellia bacterium]